jgi:hypothetical protein
VFLAVFWGQWARGAYFKRPKADPFGMTIINAVALEWHEKSACPRG